MRSRHCVWGVFLLRQETGCLPVKMSPIGLKLTEKGGEMRLIHKPGDLHGTDIRFHSAVLLKSGISKRKQKKRAAAFSRSFLY